MKNDSAGIEKVEYHSINGNKLFTAWLTRKKTFVHSNCKQPILDYTTIRFIAASHEMLWQCQKFSREDKTSDENINKALKNCIAFSNELLIKKTCKRDSSLIKLFELPKDDMDQMFKSFIKKLKDQPELKKVAQQSEET